MSISTTERVSDEQIADFERDGIICLRGAFSQDWVERLQRATEQNLAEPGPAKLQDIVKGHLFHRDRHLWERNADFRAFVFESPAAEIARAVMRATKVNFYFDHLLVKEPGADAPTPWHQDQPYWPVWGTQIVSIWLALDPVTLANGGVEYVRGSHRWGKWYQPKAFGAQSPIPSDEGQMQYDEIPDVDARRAEFDLVTYDMQPGDCTIHHALTVHGAPGNTSSTTRRRGLSTRWVGDDARYDPRPKTDLFLRSEELSAGDPFGGAKFPQLFPRA